MSKWIRWAVIPVAALLAIATILFALHSQIERGIIAYHISRAGIFTPPTPTSGESQWLRRWRNARSYWDFSELRIARERRLKQLNPELRPLIRELNRRQVAGENMQYSMHIYREIRWRLNFTPDVATTRARIEDLRESLNQPQHKAQATQQQTDDGSWGMGIDPSVWYLRLYYTVEDGLTRDKEPQYSLRLLDRINSPQKLDAQLDSVRFEETPTFRKENNGPRIVKLSSGLTEEAYRLIRTSSSADVGVATSVSCSASGGGP